MRARSKAGPVVGVIPARWGSTRLPGKSLLPLCGKPLIQWVVERAQRARRLDRLLVATDDERIRAAAWAAGAEAVLTRSDHASGTDRIAEALRGVEAQTVVNIQGDEPLIAPRLIDRLAEALGEGADWDMATAAGPIESEADLRAPTVVKVVFDRAGRALYFSRSPIPFVRDGAPPAGGPTHWRHVGIYAYRRAFLERFVRARPCLAERLEKLEQLRALHLGARIKVLRAAAPGPGVDAPEDVPRVEALLRAEGRAERGKRDRGG